MTGRDAWWSCAFCGLRQLTAGGITGITASTAAAAPTSTTSSEADSDDNETQQPEDVLEDQQVGCTTAAAAEGSGVERVLWSLSEGPALQRLNVFDDSPVHADFLADLEPLPGVEDVAYHARFWRKHGPPPGGAAGETATLWHGHVRHHLKGGNKDSHHHELWRMLLIKRDTGSAWLWPVGRDSDFENVATMDLEMERCFWPLTPTSPANIVWLDISGTGLTALPDGLWELRTLRRLEAHCNALEAVPDGLAELSGLDYLSLHSNAITTVTPHFTRLSRLRWLSFNGNQLTHLPALPPSVQRLSFHCNKLVELPELGLGGPDVGANVLALSLFGNRLSRLPDVLPSRLPLCTTFSLMRNALTELPESLGDMAELTDMWVFSNALSRLPDSMSRLRNLKRLWIDHNRIVALPAAIGDCAALEELYAVDNLLTVLPASMVRCTALAKLNVDRNPPELLLSLPPFLRAALIGESAIAILDVPQPPQSPADAAAAAEAARHAVDAAHDEASALEGGHDGCGFTTPCPHGFEMVDEQMASLDTTPIAALSAPRNGGVVDSSAVAPSFSPSAAANPSIPTVNAGQPHESLLPPLSSAPPSPPAAPSPPSSSSWQPASAASTCRSSIDLAPNTGRSSVVWRDSSCCGSPAKGSHDGGGGGGNGPASSPCTLSSGGLADMILHLVTSGHKKQQQQQVQTLEQSPPIAAVQQSAQHPTAQR